MQSLTTKVFRQAVVFALLLTTAGLSAQNRANSELSEAQIQELKKYPLNDFKELFTRLQNEIKFPTPRSESHLLTLLPPGTVVYAAFPNYGEAAEQALRIFREERQSRPALRKWWQSGDMAKTGTQLEAAIQQLIDLSQYFGDEIVISGAMNGSKAPSIVLLAEVRKPGLKQALERASQQLANAGKSTTRILDQQSLALPSAKSNEPVILVRPEYVIAGSDIESVRNLSRRIDSGAQEFSSTAFGQRITEGYKDAVSVIAGVDLQTILRKAPIPAQQSQTLRETGFGDVKYLTWEYTRTAGKASSEGELSFTGPRHGIASWLGSPRDLGSLNFASPNATAVASIVLKNPAEIFSDIQKLATASNPNAFASLDQMQQGLGLNLKDDLLGQLSGEITLEVDDITNGKPAWKAMFQVKDAARLQQALKKMLATVPVSDSEFKDNGVTYHSLTVPSPTKSTEIGYAFLDGYLLIGSGDGAVREAIRLHREGSSLAKSSKFLAALPAGHSKQASALYYSDPMKTLGLQLARLSPELAQLLFQGNGQGTPTVTCAYADESTIRGASASQGLDAGVVLVAAAVAIPNLLRAKNSANEASAVGSMRTIVAAQLSYSVTYPARGYAKDLASLGVDPLQPNAVSPKHAGFLDSGFAKSTCTAGTWCEKTGYKFTLSPVCPKLLCPEFVAVATPVTPSAGNKNFCATSDGIIRFKVEEPLIAPLFASQCRAWEPVQ